MASPKISNHFTGKRAFRLCRARRERKGGHCHLLAHIPDALAPLVARRQRAWIKAITGKPYKARVIYGRAIVGAANAGAGGLYKANITAALGYILKGANAAAAARYGLTRLEPGGVIIGKRCGVSQNIGPKARGRK